MSIMQKIIGWLTSIVHFLKMEFAHIIGPAIAVTNLVESFVANNTQDLEAALTALNITPEQQTKIIASLNTWLKDAGVIEQSASINDWAGVVKEVAGYVSNAQGAHEAATYISLGAQLLVDLGEGKFTLQDAISVFTMLRAHSNHLTSSTK